MNCTHIEKLLPLYVEGDLKAERAEAVRLHLDACCECRGLAAEYRESQSWLRSASAPDFDHAFFDDLRDAVRREIEQGSSPHWLFQAIRWRWSWKPVLAASLAMLFIGLGLAVYWPGNRENGDSKPGPKIANGKAPDATKAGKDNERPGPGEQPEGGKQSEKVKQLRRKLPVAPVMSQEPPLRQAHAARPKSPVNEIESATPTGNAASPETLRIEIQTADPNIRIIWFASKQVPAPSSKTGSDTE
jgi:hypothetical protein